MENAVVRGTQHTFAGKAADEAGNVRVRNGLTAADHAAQRVSAHRLNDRVAVAPGAEAGADTDDQRCIRNRRAKVFLCQNRVNQHIRPQPCAALCLRVRQNRNIAVSQNMAHICLRRGKFRRHVLYLIASV